MAVNIEGVDYAYAPPSVGALKAADKHFAVRYITTPGHGAKGISKAEYDALHAAGIAVAVVYEGAAADMKKGKAQGIADAKAAQANLKGIVGLGDNLPVYFACDWDATPGDQTAINAYLDGAASVIGRDRVGIYGSYYVCKRAKAANKATWLWQTYAWSGGQVLDGIHLYQYKNNVSLAGGTVDLVRAFQKEYGQSNVEKPAPAPLPAPKPAVPPVVKPPVIVPPAPVSTPDEIAHDNADFDATKFVGTYYFKGADKPEIYVYDPATGKKRHVSAAEWTIVKGYGHAQAYVIPQNAADDIPA